MGDMLAMAERLAEAKELDRLREENAALRSRWDDYVAVSSRAGHLGLMNRAAWPRRTAFPSNVIGILGEEFGPSALRKHMLSEHFRLFGF